MRMIAESAFLQLIKTTKCKFAGFGSTIEPNDLFKIRIKTTALEI